MLPSPFLPFGALVLTICTAARPLFQKLLEDRFELVVHHETRDMTTYELLACKSGQKMAPSKDASCVKPIPENFPKPGEPAPRFCGKTSVRPNMIEAYGVPMERFVATFSSALGRNVIDKTRIKENVVFIRVHSRNPNAIDLRLRFASNSD